MPGLPEMAPSAIQPQTSDPFARVYGLVHSIQKTVNGLSATTFLLEVRAGARPTRLGLNSASLSVLIVA